MTTSWPCCRHALLQTLEAISFVARHLDPPGFRPCDGGRGRAGRSAATRFVRGLANGRRNSPPSNARSKLPATLRYRPMQGLRAVQHGNGDHRRRVSRLALRAAGAGGALSLRGRAGPGQPLLPGARRRATTRRCWRGWLAPPQRGHRRDHAPGGRAGRPRRRLALCARGLHARARLAAGGRPARRRRQRPLVPVELAARCAQPRRDPAGADRARPKTWAITGPDADTPNLLRMLEQRCRPAGTSIQNGCC